MTVLASTDPPTPILFLGADLLAYLVLALGGAMAAGNLAALIRPRRQQRDPTDLAHAPVGRSVVFVVVGMAAAVWAVATLVYR